MYRQHRFRNMKNDDLNDDFKSVRMVEYDFDNEQKTWCKNYEKRRYNCKIALVMQNVLILGVFLVHFDAFHDLFRFCLKTKHVGLLLSYLWCLWWYSWEIKDDIWCNFFWFYLWLGKISHCVRLNIFSWNLAKKSFTYAHAEWLCNSFQCCAFFWSFW